MSGYEEFDDVEMKELFTQALTTKEAASAVTTTTAPPEDSIITDTTSLARILRYASIFTTNEGIYSHFFFMEDGVITTDGAFMFHGDLKDLPSATLPAKSVIKFLSVCPTDNVHWRYGKDKTSIIFESGSYKTQVANTYVSEIPSPKELFGSPIDQISKKTRKEIKITADIVNGLQKIAFCSVPYNDTGKQEIKGIRVEPNGLFSTDSYGIASVLMNTGIEEPFTLPTRLADFMVQYGLPPQSCFLTKDFIVVQYPKIRIIGRLNHFPYPAIVMSRILSFKPSASIAIEDSDAAKAGTLKRLAITDGSAITLKPVGDSYIELSVTDMLGHKTSEVTSARNDLKGSFMTGIRYFKGGYKLAKSIQVFDNGGDTVQIMFANNDLHYLLLGKKAS
jgi:hypothetical protein